MGAATAPTGEAVESEEMPTERPPAMSPGLDPGAARNARQVHAVPTNAQLKLDRAAEVFNESEHRRTIAGLARTLGAPEVSALATSAAEVLVTIAWELAWYQFAIDLSDPREPVQLRARGEELDELPEPAREWNAQILTDGALAIGTSGSDPTSPQGADAPAPTDP